MLLDQGTLLVPIVILVALLIIVSKALIRITPNQLGIARRFGRYHATLSPGIHLRIPLIDTVDKVDGTSGIARWDSLSPNQRISAAQSLVLLGEVDLDFKLELTASQSTAHTDELVTRSLARIPRSRELDALLEWLTAQATAQTGVELSHDKLALVRLTEAAHRALESIKTVDPVVIDIPFITADASGPKHVRLEIRRADMGVILKSS